MSETSKASAIMVTKVLTHPSYSVLFFAKNKKCEQMT